MVRRLLDRLSENPVYGPTLPQSSKDRVLVNAKSLRPFSDTQGYSAVRKQTVGSLVAVLLLVGCPAAVSGSVVPTVVYPVDRMTCAWPAPHVIKECFKGKPSLAHRDSPATVEAICLGFWISASLDHGVPSLILWTPAHSMLDGSPVSFCGNVRVETPATPRQPVCKIVTINYTGASTAALTQPHKMVAPFASKGNNYPSAKCLSSEVNETLRCWTISNHALIIAYSWSKSNG
jgi:hypothetical protein